MEQLNEAKNNGKEDQEKLMQKITQLQREKKEGERSRILLQ